MIRNVVFLGLALAVALAPAALGDYQGLSPADQFNVFVLGDFSQTWTDAGGSGPNNGMGVAVGGNFAPANNGAFTVHGNVVVGGNYKNGGTSIAGSIVAGGTVDASNHSVAGSIVGNGVTVKNGSVAGSITSGAGVSTTSVSISGSVAGNNVSMANSSAPGGSIQYVSGVNVPGYFPANKLQPITATQLATDVQSAIAGVGSVDFTAAGAYFKGLADSLHDMTGNGTVGFAGNHLSLTGSGSNFYVFHVTATQLRTMSSFTLNVGNAGQIPTVVIDIVDDGTAYTFANKGLNYVGTDTQHVLFNFGSATAGKTIDTNHIGIKGAMLAPYADVFFNSGNIDGQMIAGSLRGTGESHAYRFLGSLPAPVPEPGSLALVGMGLCGVLALAYRARRAA